MVCPPYWPAPKSGCSFVLLPMTLMYLSELGSGRAEDGGSVCKVLEQLADAHGSDMFNEIQRHQSFPGLHADLVSQWEPCCKPK